jgi:very-short-patch-repair endonuclease
VEADTWRFHAENPEMFNRDLRRYTLLTSCGWLVVRFGWHDVMEDSEFVSAALCAVVSLRETQAAAAWA